MDYTIRNMAGGKEIVIMATDRCAGVISSIVWNGKEFVDKLDHGREVQSAISLDGLGEGNNPTAAGSSLDGVGPTSTSRLLDVQIPGTNALYTKIQMAYWNPVDGVVLSDHIVEDRVKIGHSATDYAIEYLVKFTVPADYMEAKFEFLTGYMPPEFSDAWGWNPLTHEMDVTPEGGQKIPVVLSTPNQQFAMGVYSPDPEMLYGSYTAASLKNPVVKWNCGYWSVPCPAGYYRGHCYVVIGTLEDCRVSMIQLQEYFKRFAENTMYNAHRQELEGLKFYPDMSDQNLFDKMEYLERAMSQDRGVYAEYEEAMTNLLAQPEANKIMRRWLLDQDISEVEVMKAFSEAAPPAPGPVPDPGPPSQPGAWQPPSGAGLQLICKRPGGFFMSGMRVSDGLLLGTYRYAQLAHALFYDGAFHEQISLPTESVYMFYMPPDGHPIFSTECQAQIFKHGGEGWFSEGNWQRRFTRPEPLSCAFEIQEIEGGLSLFTTPVAWGQNGIQMYKAGPNGESWSKWGQEWSGKYLFNSCTDKKTAWLYGHEQDYPVMYDMNGNRIMRMGQYAGQMVGYVITDGKLFSLGMSNITPIDSEGSPRRAYINNFWDGKNQDAIELTRPWVMDMQIHNGVRYCLTSVWNDGDSPQWKTAELHHSTDQRTWKLLCTIPMPTALCLAFGDGGVYIFGGHYNDYGAVYFYKL
jgi:hypothetical protein